MPFSFPITKCFLISVQNFQLNQCKVTMYDNMYQLVAKGATKGTSIYESINVGERVSRKTTECCNSTIQETRRGKLSVQKPPAPKVLSLIKKMYLQSPFRARLLIWEFCQGSSVQFRETPQGS